MDEEWRPIHAWPRKQLDGRYEVSNLGRVRCVWPHGQQPQIMQLSTITGRAKVTLWTSRKGKAKGFTHLVHLLVANAFLGPRAAGMEVTHRDWDRMNNSVSNLMVATHDEIMARAAKDGRLPWLRAAVA
jgi:hypothetical protein